jgi:hypothetical protein
MEVIQMNYSLAISDIDFNFDNCDEGSHSSEVLSPKPKYADAYGFKLSDSKIFQSDIFRVGYSSSSGFTNTEIVSEPQEEGSCVKIQNYLLEKSKGMLFNVIEGDKELLQNEGVDLPSQVVIDQTLTIISRLAENNIFPHKISTSIEEGVCLTFTKANERFYLELYNDGEKGYAIEDPIAKKVLENEDLLTYDQAIQRVKGFYF